MTPPPIRSTFVTVLAWIYIVLSGFCAVIGLLQNVMIATLFRGPEFQQGMPKIPPGMPGGMAFMVEHIQLFFLLAFLACVIMLVLSIGLLRRWNWARLGFIAMMVLAMVWNVAGIVLQIYMFREMRADFAAKAAQGMPDMDGFFVAMGIFSGLFALAFVLLHGWIAWRLRSPAIAAEFAASRRTA